MASGGTDFSLKAMDWVYCDDAASVEAVLETPG
jgi:hypothetical protein